MHNYGRHKDITLEDLKVFLEYSEEDYDRPQELYDILDAEEKGLPLSRSERIRFNKLVSDLDRENRVVGYTGPIY